MASETLKSGSETPMPTTIVIDVREWEEFSSEHAVGALHLPCSRLQALLPGMLPHLKGARVQLLCESGVRAALAKKDFETLGAQAQCASLEIFEGGMVAWRAAGKPTEASGRSRFPLMRQVQLVTGLGVVGLSIPAYFQGSTWSLGTAAMGLGLVIAGSTGYCAMARILALMPWNRR